MHRGLQGFSEAGQEFCRWIDERVDNNRGGATPGSHCVQRLVDEFASAAGNALAGPMGELRVV